MARGPPSKANRFAYKHLGENRTLMMIFFNSSLRTRLSTQKAALQSRHECNRARRQPGRMETLETERGVIMDGDKPEHLLEAIPVMGCYCDIIGVRSFARFESKEDDYQEKVINQIHTLLRAPGILNGGRRHATPPVVCRPHHNQKGIRPSTNPK